MTITSLTNDPNKFSQQNATCIRLQDSEFPIATHPIAVSPHAARIEA